MELLVNDLSLHGQFGSASEFAEAVGRLMAIRAVTRRFGRELYCHRSLCRRQATPQLSLIQIAQRLPHDQRAALLQWLTRTGPFWEDGDRHDAEEWLECRGDIVTDSALGEAAWWCLHGAERQLVSVSPSTWLATPLEVAWRRDYLTVPTYVANHWEAPSVELTLRSAEPPVRTWNDLAERAMGRFTGLVFAADAFSPLDGHPFASAAAERTLVLLNVLSRLKACFDEAGRRTAEGQALYQTYFTGKKGDGGRGAWFTDSSETEKAEFGKKLRFRHPDRPGETLECPWHGKVQTPQLRIHFSYPILVDRPLYIVYVGPKLTKR